MHDQQTPGELEAHLGPGGPVVVVADWIGAVFGDLDLRVAWRLMDPSYRLALAQAWLWANRAHPSHRGIDLDEAAAGISAAESRHPLWPPFEDSQMKEFLELEITFDGWGFASRPRPVAPDYELVKFLHTGTADEVFVTEPTQMMGHLFLMHHVAGRWQMAGFGSSPLEPGWPPTWAPPLTPEEG